MLNPEEERLEAIGEQLVTKISSKFTAATFLAGFATSLLGGQVLTMWQTTELPFFYGAAAGVLGGAVVLFVQSVLRFDELTMPKRFWKSDPTVSNTSGHYPIFTIEDLWTLQKRMAFYWHRLTMAAALLTALATLLLLFPLAPTSTQSVRQEIFWWVLACSAVAICYGTLVTLRAQKIGQLVRPVD